MTVCLYCSQFLTPILLAIFTAYLCCGLSKRLGVGTGGLLSVPFNSGYFAHAHSLTADEGVRESTGDEPGAHLFQFCQCRLLTAFLKGDSIQPETLNLCMLAVHNY